MLGAIHKGDARAPDLDQGHGGKNPPGRTEGAPEGRMGNSGGLLHVFPTVDLGRAGVNEGRGGVVYQFEYFSITATISEISQTWSVRPSSIAGVTRRLL